MRRRFFAVILTLCTLLAMLLPLKGTLADVSVSVGEIVGDRIAVRKKPSSDSNSLVRLDDGTLVQILECNVNAEWYKVKTGKYTGYVNRMYVDISPSLDSYQASGTGTVINCNNAINVRAEANTNCKILGELKKSEQVTVTRANVDAGWHEIDYNGQRAYVAAKYIDLTLKCEDSQLSSIDVVGGTLSPAFSPSEYGYILTATAGQVTVKAAGNEGVKISVGSTGVSSARYTINSGNSKTIRISVGGKVRYTIYLVRDVVTVGTWNIKRGNDSLLMQGWLIGSQRPDIMGIQEVYVGKSGNNANNLLSLRTASMNYWSFAPTIDYDAGQYGVGQLSAYPIVSEEQFELPQGSSSEPRTLQKVVYTIGDKTVSIYNTHFSYESAAIRKQQFAKVREIMNSDKNVYKILLGDFNAGESEFASFRGDYRLINNSSTKFYDYSGSRISMSQIDNILITKNITMLNARTIPNEYSDHYPLIAFLKFK